MGPGHPSSETYDLLLLGYPVNLERTRLRVCLVHFAKTCKDVNRAFEVLNEVYLQNFLHRWVVNREMNLMMLINPCLINN